MWTKRKCWGMIGEKPRPKSTSDLYGTAADFGKRGDVRSTRCDVAFVFVVVLFDLRRACLLGLCSCKQGTCLPNEYLVISVQATFIQVRVIEYCRRIR